MAEQSVAGEQGVEETALRRIGEVVRRFVAHPEERRAINTVLQREIIDPSQGSIGPITFKPPAGDLLTRLAEIEGLTIVGPKELEKICRTIKGEDPLNLGSNWTEKLGIPPIPEIMVEWLFSRIWRTNPGWNTRAALVLVPPIIPCCIPGFPNGIPTSLAGQHLLWGVPCNKEQQRNAGGIVRKDVFCDRPQSDWTDEPAVTEWQWDIAYECPRWTAYLNDKEQQEIVERRGMSISTLALDVFFQNAIIAAGNSALWRHRAETKSSTSNNGYKLYVYGTYYVSDTKANIHTEVTAIGWSGNITGNYLPASIHGVPQKPWDIA